MSQGDDWLLRGITVEAALGWIVRSYYHRYDQWSCKCHDYGRTAIHYFCQHGLSYCGANNLIHLQCYNHKTCLAVVKLLGVSTSISSCPTTECTRWRFKTPFFIWVGLCIVHKGITFSSGFCQSSWASSEIGQVYGFTEWLYCPSELIRIYSTFTWFVDLQASSH